MAKRVIVGLSGGVDSAVAALLLKEGGYEVTGVTMRLWRDGAGFRGGGDGSCFSPDESRNVAAAAAFAEAIGIPHRAFDCHAEYVRDVVDYFRRTHLAGHTPNPCVRCNARVKFGLLPESARAAGLEFDFFATGHYARVARLGDRWALLRGVDRAKDQSYFLCGLSQAQLARQLFPLGDWRKDDVRAFARSRGLRAADRPDSQDFHSGDPSELIGESDREGEIVDASGRVLGHHRGFWHYTIGQRKGLGIGGGVPYYVLDVNACANRVVVGRREDAVRTSFAVSETHWVAHAPTDAPIACRVKIRSVGEPRGPVVFANGRCTAAEGFAGVAPGQSAVFYAADTDAVLCAGTIAPDRA